MGDFVVRFVLLTVAMAIGTQLQAAPPSDTSIRELMLVTDSQRTLDLALAHMDQAMQAGIDAAREGREVTPVVAEIVHKTQTRMVALMKEEMSWPVMEPVLIEIYRQSFTQTEIDGMIQQISTGFAKLRSRESLLRRTVVAQGG